MGWAWLYSPSAPDWRRGPNLMVARSEEPVASAVQGALFYFYATDLTGLREQLQSAGLKPGPIKYPDYLPLGEMSIQDPDGYCLMIAQNNSDTP